MQWPLPLPDLQIQAFVIVKNAGLIWAGADREYYWNVVHGVIQPFQWPVEQRAALAPRKVSLYQVLKTFVVLSQVAG